MASRSDTETRQASLLLSGLVLTPDGALEVFRDRRAADPELDLEHLKRARDILDFVNTAITHAEPQRWERLKQAWELLNQPLEQPATAAPAHTRDGEPARPQRLDAAPSSRPPAPSEPPADVDQDDDPTAQVPPMVPPAASASVGMPPAAAPGGLPLAPAPVAPAPVASPIASPATGRVAGPPPSSPPPADHSPWAKASPPAHATPPPVGAAPARPPPPAPATRPPSSPLALTVDVDRLNQIKVSDETGNAGDVRPAALPFRGSVAKPPPSAVSDGDDDGGDPLMQTAYMDPRPGRATTLPFKAVPAAGVPAADGPAAGAAAKADAAAPLPAHLSAMTIEQYAALCAECSVHARWATEIAQRYGVKSEAERRALDAHFRGKMADDPKLSETWRYHYARVEQWARQQKS